jgi:hypothetical protein
MRSQLNFMYPSSIAEQDPLRQDLRAYVSLSEAPCRFLSIVDMFIRRRRFNDSTAYFRGYNIHTIGRLAKTAYPFRKQHWRLQDVPLRETRTYTTGTAPFINRQGPKGA